MESSLYGFWAGSGTQRYFGKSLRNDVEVPLTRDEINTHDRQHALSVPSTS